MRDQEKPENGMDNIQLFALAGWESENGRTAILWLHKALLDFSIALSEAETDGSDTDEYVGALAIKHLEITKKQRYPGVVRKLPIKERKLSWAMQQSGFWLAFDVKKLMLSDEGRDKSIETVATRRKLTFGHVKNAYKNYRTHVVRYLDAIDVAESVIQMSPVERSEYVRKLRNNEV